MSGRAPRRKGAASAVLVLLQKISRNYAIFKNAIFKNMARFFSVFKNTAQIFSMSIVEVYWQGRICDTTQIGVPKGRVGGSFWVRSITTPQQDSRRTLATSD